MIPKPVANDFGKNVLVIGGGVTGILSAWELVRMGAKVILVEARHMGSGASSRSAACIRAQFDTISTVKGMIYSINFFENWMDIIENSQYPICQNGYLFLKNYTVDVESVKQQVAVQQKAGLKEVVWLDEAALSKQFPYLDTVGIVGATWCPKDGFLFPNIIYQDVSQAARKLGAKIIQNDPVVKAEVSGNKATAVILESGSRIEADFFINAANVWAAGISRLFGGIDLPITAERRYLYFLRGLKRDSDWGFKMEDFPSLPMTVTPYGAYCRPDNKQLMIGWLQHPNPVAATLDNQDDIEPGYGLGFDEYGAAVRKEVTQFLPAVQDMGRLVAVTSGFYNSTPDHNPLFGYDLNIHNLIHATGFSGHGLMHSPFSARIVTELINSGHNIETIDLPYNIGRVQLKHMAINRTFEYFESMAI